MYRTPRPVGRPRKYPKKEAIDPPIREKIENKENETKEDIQDVTGEQSPLMPSPLKDNIVKEIKRLKDVLKEIKEDETKDEIKEKNMVNLGRFCIKLSDLRKSRLIVYSPSGKSRSSIFNHHTCSPLFKSILLGIVVDKAWCQDLINGLSDVERVLLDRLVQFSYQKFGDVIMDKYQSSLNSGLQQMTNIYHETRDKIYKQDLENLTDKDLDMFTQSIYALRYERLIPPIEFRDNLELLKEIRDSMIRLNVNKIRG